MSKKAAWASHGFLLIGTGVLLAACATHDDLRQVKEQTKRELSITQQRSAELETKVQEIRGQDLSAFQGQLETMRRDLDAMQSGLDDQKAQVFALNQKLSHKLEEQAERLSGLEKRDEATGKSLAQVTETIKGIGTKLSDQVDRQAASLSKLEETTKQMDTQVKALAAQGAQFQEALGEFSKVLHGLNDRVAEVDRRITELAGKTDGKAGMMATPEGGQAARADVSEAGPGQSAPSASDEAGAASIPAESAPKAVLSAQEMYDRAQDEYKKGRYDAAVTTFRLLLTQYPQSALVPNAHFWIAECYVKARDFRRGIEEYEQVIARYPKSGKAATALYKKASALLELNKKEAAKTALRQLIANYPESEDLQRARAKLASLK
jgi:tol-pal system protein YbgF